MATQPGDKAGLPKSCSLHCVPDAPPTSLTSAWTHSSYSCSTRSGWKGRQTLPSPNFLAAPRKQSLYPLLLLENRRHSSPHHTPYPTSIPARRFQLSSVQSLSCVQLFATPWTASHQASLSITNSQSLVKLMSIKSVMPSSHLILCHPLLFPSSIFPSIRVFSNESALHIRWPKYWSFSFNISPSSEHLGLIPFRMDWLDLLAV